MRYWPTRPDRTTPPPRRWLPEPPAVGTPWTSSRLLEGQSPEVVREADAVFAAMPAEVDQAILGALRTGFGHRSPMSLHWDRDVSEGEPTVAHRFDEPHEQNDWVHIHVIAPDGQRFL